MKQLILLWKIRSISRSLSIYSSLDGGVALDILYEKLYSGKKFNISNPRPEWPKDICAAISSIKIESPDKVEKIIN